MLSWHAQGVLARDDLIASMFVLARVGRDGVARVPLRERAEHAAAAGFAAMGTTAGDYAQVSGTGLNDKDIESILVDHGVALGEIDACPVWLGDDAPDAAHREQVDVVFHLAERFGPVHHIIVPIGASDGRLPERGALVNQLRGLAERAERIGTRIAIEFLPWGPVPDAMTAWGLARDTGHASCGITVDFWHHLTGTADQDSLRAVPGNRVHAVHLTDGAPDLTEPNPLRRTQRQRRLPGEGTLTVVETIQVLDAIGADLPYTAEASSPALHRGMTPAELAVAACAASRRVLDEARGRQAAPPRA